MRKNTSIVLPKSWYNKNMENVLWGLWNGITAWPLLILHVFDIWTYYPVYDIVRDGGWYQFGFLIGAGSPFFGLFRR